MDRRGNRYNHGLVPVIVGARASPLSVVQVQEVLESISNLNYAFYTQYIKTSGDLDTKTPLWKVANSDFFTKQIDEPLLAGTIRIAVHSAKDLPKPLPKGLSLFALTKGVDPRDSLVLRPGETLNSLRPFANVGTSSFRRRQLIPLLRPDLVGVSIRGTIHDRLEQLFCGKVDALIMAQAAIIRLQLLHLNHLLLPFESEPFQGQLAVVGREGDQEMADLFKPLDER